MKNIIYRIITSIVLLPVVIAAFFLGGYYVIALLALVSLISCVEASLITSGTSKISKLVAVLSWANFFFPSIFFRDASSIIFFFSFVTIFNFMILFFSSIQRKQFESFTVIFYWSFYINFGLASLYWLQNTPHLVDERIGLSFILLAAIATWANDSFAYIGGRLFGRLPLFKSVSGKKTWEGFIIGGVGAVAAVFCFKYLPLQFGYDWLTGLDENDLLWISLPAIVLGPFGDLVESRFKRFYNVKDSSQILPGHGGLLDRIDALLIMMPWTALYAFIIRPLW